MSVSRENEPSVIHFSEGNGEGYILVYPLPYGSLGYTYLVRSMDDGQYYVRKKYDELDEETFPKNGPGKARDRRERANDPDYVVSVEEYLMSRMTYHMVPEMVHHVVYNSRGSRYLGPRRTEGDVFYYGYANGGDLHITMEEYRLAGLPIPAPFIWALIEQMILVLAYMSDGYEPDKELPADWRPILHGEIRKENIFLHWPDDTAKLPQFLLGDWGNASSEDKKAEYWRILEREQILSFLLILRNIRSNQPRPMPMGNPIEAMKEQYLEAEKLSRADPAFSPTMYIAQNILPIARVNARRNINRVDMRWTFPQINAGYVVFGSRQHTREDDRREYEHTRHYHESIWPPWDWVEVAALPDHVRTAGPAIRRPWARDRQ